MSPARREVRPDDPSTRDGLMDAALEQLATKGVLAGLNLREVADAVGVTPANIYYYFGSREGLLRAALAREAQRLQGPLAAAAESGFVERRLAMFDAIGDIPTLALTALLALDDDKAYEPLPFLDATRERYRALVDAGELPADLDVDAAHLLSLATSIGVAIYAGAVARQLDTTPEDLRTRARHVFQQMLHAISQPSHNPDVR
jgi:AcrR family transcriptional regulator